MGLFDKVFGTYSQRELKRVRPIADKVLALDEEMSALSDSELKFGSVKPYMLFVSAGSNDTLIYSTPAGYHDAMTKNGTTHIWHYVDGGDHGGKTIRPHIYNFVRAVFKATE